jgi:hypothetical protein
MRYHGREGEMAMDVENLKQAWNLFIMDPIPFGGVLFICVGGTWAAAWFIGRHILKERLELAREQKDDLSKKLKEAQEQLTALRRQAVSYPAISATVDATEKIFNEANTISDSLGVTLTNTGGSYQLIANLPRPRP